MYIIYVSLYFYISVTILLRPLPPSCLPIDFQYFTTFVSLGVYFGVFGLLRFLLRRSDLQVSDISNQIHIHNLRAIGFFISLARQTSTVLIKWCLNNEFEFQEEKLSHFEARSILLIE